MINLTIGSLKGGVGKSTIALNFAYELSLKYKTLLIDTDQQNSLATFLCKDFKIGFLELLTENVNIDEVLQKPIKNNQNFNFIPTGNLALEDSNYYEKLFEIDRVSKVINTMFRDYDFIVYDTPPRISKHIETLSHISDDFLIVLNPDPASFLSFKIFSKFINKNQLQDKTYILINKTEPAKISEDFTKLISYTQKNVIGLVPTDTNVLDSQGHCKPITVYNPTCPFSIYLKKAVEKYVAIKKV